MTKYSHVCPEQITIANRPFDAHCTSVSVMPHKEKYATSSRAARCVISRCADQPKGAVCACCMWMLFRFNKEEMPVTEPGMFFDTWLIHDQNVQATTVCMHTILNANSKEPSWTGSPKHGVAKPKTFGVMTQACFRFFDMSQHANMDSKHRVQITDPPQEYSRSGYNENLFVYHCSFGKEKKHPK